MVLISCKVNYGFKGISIPPEAKTISVAFFQNNAAMASPSESQKFTEKMRDMVSSQTNLALTKQNGDLQFEGAIVDYSVAPVAVQSTDQAALNRLTVTINVKYTNSIDQSKSFNQNFVRFYDYSSSKTLSAIESEALDEINRQIAEDVFQKAFNNW
jgi:hypothetical protein